MMLKLDMPADILALLPDHSKQDDLVYAVPVDLNRAGDLCDRSWVVATAKRLWIIESGIIVRDLAFADLARVAGESTVNGGYLYAVPKPATMGVQEEIFLARYSKRHLVRLSYVARGLNLLIKGETQPVTSEEKEIYCSSCGRALPGTSVCPHCSGSHQTWQRLLALSKEYRKQLLMILFPILLITLISIGQRFIERYFIDSVLLGDAAGWPGIALYFGLTLILTIVLIAAYVARFLWSNRLGTRISRDLRTRVYNKSNSLALGSIEKFEAGELMNRVVQDTNQIRRFIEMVFAEMFTLVITILGTLVTMLVINWKMGLLAIIFIPLAAVIVRLFHSKEMRLWRQQWRYRDDVNSRLQDVISGIRVVKSFGQEERESARFRAATQRLRDLTRRNELFWATLYPLVTLLITSGTILISIAGGYEVLGGSLTPGQLNQYIAYAGMLYGPMNFLTRLPRQLIMVNTSLERIYDILDEPLAEEPGQKPLTEHIQGAVALEDVSFGYLSYEPVLENITAQIKAGEKIGLVGSSGAGKSTFINILMKLYQVDQGSIYLDGKNLRDLSSQSYHQQLGVVLQESFLFSGTIAENIRYAKMDATPEEIIAAARTANAHDFIVSFPDGYDTYVGEHGDRLSGGEKQRVAIARAILNNPAMLILDEPTSSLDLETEYLIQEALGRLTRGKTTFMIAHRLSTLKAVDRIMVIDKHRIAEMGSHEELMARRGIHYNLVLAQLEMHSVADMPEEAPDASGNNKPATAPSGQLN